jgi:hypothetical protein
MPADVRCASIDAGAMDLYSPSHQSASKKHEKVFMHLSQLFIYHRTDSKIMLENGYSILRFIHNKYISYQLIFTEPE